MISDQTTILLQPLAKHSPYSYTPEDLIKTKHKQPSVASICKITTQGSRMKEQKMLRITGQKQAAIENCNLQCKDTHLITTLKTEKMTFLGSSSTLMRRKAQSASHFVTAATIYSDNTAVSDRLAQFTIMISSKYHLNIIQVYLPTCIQKVEKAYKDIDSLLSSSKTHLNIMKEQNAEVAVETLIMKLTTC